ncbi:MAG: cation transporter [Burkholderiales bacterium]|nr:cation transporter [Burkholderiales bacterium]
MRQVTLTVPTMDCATCPVTIRVALLKVPGVAKATVSYARRTARVTYEDSHTEVGALTPVTAEAGYPSFQVDTPESAAPGVRQDAALGVAFRRIQGFAIVVVDRAFRAHQLSKHGCAGCRREDAHFAGIRVLTNLGGAAETLDWLSSDSEARAVLGGAAEAE